jgi:regulator of protease activity HflC (stomatin/prohibitin superfamily)
MKMSPKKIILGSVALFILVILSTMLGRLWENVDAGENVVVQDPFDGEIHVYKSPGIVWQGLGKVTHYKKSNQFWFLKPKREGDPDNAIAVKWNDGGHADISGSVRYDLPTDDANMVRLHSTFGSQEAIENSLIKTNIEKAIYMTGPLMTSKESYAERRNDLIYYIEDQASRGVYKTRQRDVKEPDPLTGEEKIVTKVEIQHDSSNVPYRQETSPIAMNGIKLYNISINAIVYDGNVEKQIATQQQATMQVQTAIANAKRAEQDAITAQKQGEANAAQAKWEQEVIKAKAVTQAEQELAVQELATKKAASYKQQQILEGEGDAAKKRLVMQANGALEQKLEAWLQAQNYWAAAFKDYKGNVTPNIMMGGQAGGGNAAQDFMQIMMMRAAKDLNLDLSNQR